MNNKFFNDAIIGNKNIKATFSKKGELLRAYYPAVDFKQFIDFYNVGVKINDSAIIYLHDDINNRYAQYYTENTNILNTEIENTYFNLKVRQTDFAVLNKNVIVRRYTFVNSNKLPLELRLLIRSKLLSDYNNMVSARVIQNGMIQYNHDFSISTFANHEISGHRINDVEDYIREAKLTDKDYIGMSNDSAISYDLGTLQPGDQIDFNVFIYIENNKTQSGSEFIEEEIEKLKRLDVAKEYMAAKKYWRNYLEKHDGLKLNSTESREVGKRTLEIYNRTILLFPLLQNEETGGMAAAIEVDENREKCGRYSYCWPRDAIFMTKALDYLNMTKETEKFYNNFCKKTQSNNGMWEQRFYTDCSLAPCWGYQIDETASIIYGIYEHYKITKEIKFLESNLKMCENALKFIFKYLENIFGEKEENDIVKKEIEEKIKESGKQSDKIYNHLSYDLWEMNEGVHLYSLAAIYAALNSMNAIYNEIKAKYENNRLKIEQIVKKSQKINKELENIKNYIENNLLDENTKILKRNTIDNKTDISLVGIVYPFELFGTNEKKVINTIEKINMTLRTYTGGYLRFEDDNYMGGKNPWVIATLWMALYYIEAGEDKKAKEAFNFVVNSSSDLGFLAEQIDNKNMQPAWVVGLGWSHAMFIITLEKLLKK